MSSLHTNFVEDFLYTIASLVVKGKEKRKCDDGRGTGSSIDKERNWRAG